MIKKLALAAVIAAIASPAAALTQDVGLRGIATIEVAIPRCMALDDAYWTQLEREKFIEIKEEIITTIAARVNIPRETAVAQVDEYSQHLIKKYDALDRRGKIAFCDSVVTMAPRFLHKD